MIVFTVCRVGGSAVQPCRWDVVRGCLPSSTLLSFLAPPGGATHAQAELFQNYTTIEYTLRPPASTVPTYLLIVDTVLAEDELGELKKSLQQALSLLPENALVGLITFGTHVQVSVIRIVCFARAAPAAHTPRSVPAKPWLSKPHFIRYHPVSN